VNNSWGTTGPFDPKDPINKATKQVSSKGITVVFAAGNDGPFSSRGIPGDPLYHPDVTAPGVHIVSTRASTGIVLNVSDANHDLNLTSTCALSVANAPYYTCASGTSMATPHVTGVVALMQEAAGGRLAPDQVASVLTQTARPLPGYALWEVGTGYVDALAAVNAVRQ